MSSCSSLLIISFLYTNCRSAVNIVNCDIVIGGGNTAALSAAITISEAALASNTTVKICLLEPTDWYGGQLTAQGVSAIDFGSNNRYSQNQGSSFRALSDTIAPGGKNVGNCWVSKNCYQPQNLMNEFILNVLYKYSDYITVYNRTVITNTITKTDSDNKKYISSVTAIQRQPINISKEWTYLLSEQLEDWYSPNNSTLFTKTEYQFNGKIFIEATEFGDIMMTSDLYIFQGVETPNETSLNTTDQCGQAITITFFMELLEYIPLNPPIIPNGNNEGKPYSYQNDNWLKTWTYRRAYDAAGPNSVQEQINVNDITQQNWGGGNDFDTQYIFLPIDMAKNGQWKGGINITALSQAEQRAFGFYHFYINTSNQNTNNTFDPRQLVMNLICTNTSTGLSKIPYFRDNKRSYGLFGFKLNHTTMLPIWNQTSKHGNYAVGYRFNDTIAIGNYPFDMHLLSSDKCENQYPQYIKSHSQRNVPYYIPFRCIGNNIYKNLLFGGKNIAQSFYANAGTRLHPAEWNTGVAAGGAAYFMMENEINDTETVYNQIDKLQKLLQSDNINQPLDWN